MTLSEVFWALMPLLGCVLLTILIVVGVQIVLILSQFKRMMNRVDTLSDVSGWLSLLRHRFWNKKSMS